MNYRPWLLTYLRVVAVGTVLQGLMLLHTQDSWAMGDWLVNYHAGFVRRGLPGEMILRAALGVHASPLVLVLTVQLLCYAALLWAVHGLLRGGRLPLWAAAAVLSPATLGFQVLEPRGGFRKEILLLAGLGLSIAAVRRWPERSGWLAAMLAGLGVVCVLSHESLILFLGYAVAAVGVGLGDVRRALKLCVLPGVLSLCAFVLVAKHPGNAEVARGICASLGYAVDGPLPAPCSGAIDYLRRDLPFARAQVAESVELFHYGRTYSVAVALAMLPLAIGFAALWRRRAARSALRVVAVTAALTMLASLPLFFYATDWGRWIYIHCTCLMLLLLQIERQTRAEGAEVMLARPGWWRAGAVALILVYATCWELPYVGQAQWTLPSGYARIVMAAAGTVR